MDYSYGTFVRRLDCNYARCGQTLYVLHCFGWLRYLSLPLIAINKSQSVSIIVESFNSSYALYYTRIATLFFITLNVFIPFPYPFQRIIWNTTIILSNHKFNVSKIRAKIFFKSYLMYAATDILFENTLQCDQIFFLIFRSLLLDSDIFVNQQMKKVFEHCAQQLVEAQTDK